MDEKPKLKDELRSKTIGYIATALGLVVGLAWNDTIKEFITYLFPLSTDSLWAKFAYAVILTVVVVIAINLMTRFAEKKADR